MQEFSSISASTYDPDSLTGQLTEQVADGWSIVAIVPTGTTVTAYLSRETAGSPTEPAAGDDVLAGAAPAVVDDPAPAAAPAEPVAAEPAVAEPVAAEPVVAEHVSQPAAAPAGWYADPAGRFELRYWDGGTWTEHVSRAGQQYTDPPVA